MDPQADVKPLPHPEPMDLEDLNLASLLDFRPDQGIIRLHKQRVVILSAAAMGLLRKELIDTLGLETARRLMLRFGYADGYHDAVKKCSGTIPTRPNSTFTTMVRALCRCVGLWRVMRAGT
jgi:hypothetical protein